MDQSRPLKKDDKIAFYDEAMGRWKKVTITSYPINKKGWKDWFNYIDEAGVEGGAFFKTDERWTIFNDCVEELAVFGAIPQVDGTDIPDSMTPDTTPEEENAQPHFTGTRTKIRLDTAQYLSSNSGHCPGVC